MKGPELNIEFCAYYNDKKEKFDEGGLYPFLEYCQSSKPKDVVVRVDYEMGFDEIDIYCESLAISKLTYEKTDDRNFVAKFTCDSKSGKPLMRVIYALGEAGNGGHSYGFTVGKEKFYFDGDGADRIMKINGVKFNKIKNAYDLGKVWNDTTRKNNEENTDKNMVANIEEIVNKTLKNCVNEIKKQGLNEFARPSNGFRYMLQQVSKRLCYMIRNFIDNCENLNKPYTRDDIRKYMEMPFMKNKEKYPSLPDNTLDKCIDFVLDNGRGDFFMLRESHGQKKHNSPKNTLAAMRKGNREADQEMYGGGFRQTKKVHKAKNDYDRKSNKVDLDKLDRYDESVNRISMNDIHYMVTESVKRMLKEMYNINDNPYPENENKNMIYQLAYGEIDYLYNEGVVNYNDENLCAMANGEKPIDYCDLIKCMLYDYGTKLENEAGQMLRNYCRLSKHYGEAIPDVEEAIDLAVKNFVNNSNCCLMGI